jgi:hypothetical protein
MGCYEGSALVLIFLYDLFKTQLNDKVQEMFNGVCNIFHNKTQEVQETNFMLMIMYVLANSPGANDDSLYGLLSSPIKRTSKTFMKQRIQLR